MKRVFLGVFSFFSLSLALSYAYAFELSADMLSMHKGQTSQSKMYMKDKKFRMETKEQQGYTIMRQDKNVMWMVMPEEKSYMEIALDPRQVPKTDEKYQGEISRKLLGKETIEGHPTEKYEVTYKEGGKTERIYQWMATDIKFPIKTEAVDGSWKMQYKNIKKSAPDSLFEVPSGYTKISMPSMPGMGGMMKKR